MLAVAYYIQTIKDRFAAADNERGATAVEYGLMLAAIAVAVIAFVFTLGDNVADMFDDVNTAIVNGGPAAT